MRKSTRNLWVLPIHRLGTYISRDYMKYRSLGKNMPYNPCIPGVTWKSAWIRKVHYVGLRGIKTYTSLLIKIFWGSITIWNLFWSFCSTWKLELAELTLLHSCWIHIFFILTFLLSSTEHHRKIFLFSIGWILSRIFCAPFPIGWWIIAHFF